MNENKNIKDYNRTFYMRNNEGNYYSLGCVTIVNHDPLDKIPTSHGWIYLEDQEYFSRELYQAYPDQFKEGEEDSDGFGLEIYHNDAWIRVFNIDFE